MNKLAALAVTVLLAACSSSKGDTPAGDNQGTPGQFIDGFNPTPAQDGYTRYVLPPIRNIAPAADQLWCQYITPPMDADMDMVEVTGQQSKGGHHIVLYATSLKQPVGTTTNCGDDDMVAVRFLGGIGGEGAGAIAQGLPAGTVFRIPKGYALLANVHFINTTDHPMDGQGVVDVKATAADHSKKTASLFSNVAMNLKLAANQAYKYDVSCTLKEDLDVLFFANHMHELGTSAYSELTRKDGSKNALREDRSWTKDDVFNLKFNKWTVDAPMKLKAGDVVHTHCEWDNTRASEVTFPTEMCVGVGVFIGAEEIHCVENDWSAGN